MIETKINLLSANQGILGSLMIVTSLMISNYIIKALSPSLGSDFFVCFIFSSCGLASSVRMGIQHMAMFGPGLHLFNLDTTSRDPNPISPKKASDWPSLGHMPILDQSLARGCD